MCLPSIPVVIDLLGKAHLDSDSSPRGTYRANAALMHPLQPAGHPLAATDPPARKRSKTAQFLLAGPVPPQPDALPFDNTRATAVLPACLKFARRHAQYSVIPDSVIPPDSVTPPARVPSDCRRSPDATGFGIPRIRGPRQTASSASRPSRETRDRPTRHPPSGRAEP